MLFHFGVSFCAGGGTSVQESIADTFASNTDIAILIIVALVFVVQIVAFVVLFRQRNKLRSSPLVRQRDLEAFVELTEFSSFQQGCAPSNWIWSSIAAPYGSSR